MMYNIKMDTEILSISSYLTDMYKMRKGDKRILLRQLKPIYLTSKQILDAFQDEIELGKGWNHKNILRYGPVHQNDNGNKAIQMEITQLVTLENFLFEHPTFVVNRKEIIRILNEVMDAIDYLHSRGCYHLHLHPRNILLTKDSLTVKLVNPLFTYLACTIGILPQKDEYIAPELWSISTEKTDLMKCELYSMGKLIQHIYSTSSLPYSMRSAVNLATTDNVEKRLKSLDDFKERITRKKRILDFYKILLWICGIALACWGAYKGTTSSFSEDEILFIKPTADSIYVYDSISQQGYYLSDSAATVQAEELSNSFRNMENKYMKKVEDIFKRKFREKAIPIIDKIYSRNNMSSDDAIFSCVSNEGMHELQEIQKELGEICELDEYVTTQLAAEIIKELTQNKMSEYIKE